MIKRIIRTDTICIVRIIIVNIVDVKQLNYTLIIVQRGVV